MSSVIRLNDPEDKSAKSRAFRKQFADNLNAALDRKGAIPSGYGRVIGVAELFGVSQNTAANWLKGTAFELPTFVCVLFVGVLLRNGLTLLRWHEVGEREVSLLGNVSLSLFLAIALMSLMTF